MAFTGEHRCPQCNRLHRLASSWCGACKGAAINEKQKRARRALKWCEAHNIDFDTLTNMANYLEFWNTHHREDGEIVENSPEYQQWIDARREAQS